MSRWRLLIRSLLFHRRIHGSVALGVAAAAAVLTGSLLVGASMRGSLRDLTLQRLGDIDEVLTTQRFFDEANVLATLGSQRAKVAGLIWLPGSTAETAGRSAVRRSADIQAIGADQRLWEFWPSQPRPKRLPETGEALINQALADDLGINSAAVMAGEEVLITLRPPRFESVSSDSPLGEKEDLTYALPRLRVIEVLPNLGAGRFGLQPTQLVPRTAWVGVTELQRLYEVEQRINSLWVGDDEGDDAPNSSETVQLNQSLRPTFADYGLLLKRAQRSFPADAEADVDAVADADPVISSPTIFDWWYLSSDRMVIDEAMADDLMPILSPLGAVPVMTYLANDIGRFSAEGAAPDGKQGVPFSMVSAVDFDASFAPLSAVTGEPIGPLQENEIVLNEWAANDLGVVTGDLIRLTYFLPETAHGKTEESFVDLKLKDIAALTTPSRAASRRRPAEYDQPPTLINDPDLTPEVPGVTDQESIENWDLPFPTADRNREQDDEYWEQHRTTPKAFVNYSLGAKLWGSRFGSVTSFRLPASAISKTELESQVLAALHQSSNRHGFEFRSVKRDGLQSAAGTTPFDGLFLGLSHFVIVAALLLVVLLYRLGLERRLPEIGTLMAIGFSRRLVAQVLVAEGGIVASGGAALGVLIGIVYAAIMVFGLQTWWVGAVRTPFLTLHISPTALVIGFTASLLVCGATIAWTVLRFRPGAVRGLLAGRIEEEQKDTRRSSRGFFMVPMALLSIALLAAIGATQLGGEAQAGAFLGAGAAILAACLTTLRGWLRREASASTLGGLVSLAQRNGARNPTRSTLTIGLVAAATFLIGGISAFRLSPTERGVGGFDLVASTSRPIFADLNDSGERDSRFGSAAEELEGVEVLAFRWRRGDDASCNNPFRATQPQVMGVSLAVAEWFDDPEHPKFGWAGVDSTEEAVQRNPWRALFSTNARDARNFGSANEPVAVVIDKNTAMWGLQIYSVGQEFSLDYDGVGSIRFKVVAFLDNTILQGRLMMSDVDFRRLFPTEEGDRYFLMRTGAGEDNVHREQVRSLFEDRLGDVGFATRRSEEVLSELLAVQNTYLSTFQSLGALGLLLGTFGLATVQLRSVLERRGELALMQAIGFRRGRLMRLIALENAWLLLVGLGIGTLSAASVVLPHWWLGAASVPWTELLMILGVVSLIGILTGALASRGMLQIDVKQSLRG